MIYLWIYIGVIVVLSCIYMLFYNHRKQVSKTLITQIDKILYFFDTTVYKNQMKIFDYATTKPLLFHNQQAFFNNGKDYTELMPLLLQDITYLSTLTQTMIISQEDIQSIQDVYETEQNLSTLKHYTHTILIILTLGIAKLFLP